MKQQLTQYRGMCARACGFSDLAMFNVWPYGARKTSIKLSHIPFVMRKVHTYINTYSRACKSDGSELS